MQPLRYGELTPPITCSVHAAAAYISWSIARSTTSWRTRSSFAAGRDRRHLRPRPSQPL